MAYIYVDVDGTLTDDGAGGGDPRLNVIDKVKRLIEDRHTVIIWTGGSINAARKLCDTHGIRPIAILHKPSVMVDDNPNVRPCFEISKGVISPEQFLEMGF